MIQKTFIILIFNLSIICFQLTAQNKFTLSGTVKDSASGEEVIGAVVRVDNISGVSTNNYGFFSITLTEGSHVVKIHSMGYDTKTLNIKLESDQKINIALQEQIFQTEEIVIKSKKENKNIENAQLGVNNIEIKEISKIPVLLGEKDILKTIQLLPGIKSAGEGSSGFNVRGGGTDQNLILLDEATVYNSSHLLGFFSTFNSDAIKNMQIYKGSQPAQFGGRLASVLDIKMKEGNNQKFGASGGIGLISSRLTLEGPIVKNKGSFIISGRRTYLDQFLKLSTDSTINKSQLYFYDINVKANYEINSKNKFFVSLYNGRDKIGFGNFGIDWGNTTLTTRLNHIINSKWFSNTSLIYTNYDYDISINTPSGNVNINSKIRDYNIKQEFNYYHSPNSNFIIGFNSIYHTITPGQISSTSSTINTRKVEDRYSWENSIYLTHDYKFSPRVNLLYGARLTSFSVLGDGHFFNYDAQGSVTDSSYYSAGSVVKNYLNIEPRFGMSYTLNENKSLKLGYTRNVQNIHQLSNSTSTNPTDRWISSSNLIKPSISDQFALGYFQNFKDNQYEFSAETYYKAMQNEIDFKNGGNTIVNSKIEGELKYGIGRAYGIEFLLKKKTGKLTGWIGYTLSRTERQIDGVNNNNWYAAKQDRTHDISVVGIYDISPKLSFSGTWVYNTGNAVTFPSGKYNVDGKVQFLYTERNGYRMPAYHRLDLGLNWTRKKTAKIESSWSFSIYNVYARANAYTINFEVDPNDSNKTQAIKTSLFRFVPAVSYNFKF